MAQEGIKTLVKPKDLAIYDPPKAVVSIFFRYAGAPTGFSIDRFLNYVSILTVQFSKIEGNFPKFCEIHSAF